MIVAGWPSPLTPIGLARRAEIDPGAVARRPGPRPRRARAAAVRPGPDGAGRLGATRATGAAGPAGRPPGGPPRRSTAWPGRRDGKCGHRDAARPGVGPQRHRRAVGPRGGGRRRDRRRGRHRRRSPSRSSLGRLVGCPGAAGLGRGRDRGQPRRGRFDSPDREARRLAGNPNIGGSRPFTTPAESIRDRRDERGRARHDPLKGDILPTGPPAARCAHRRARPRPGEPAAPGSRARRRRRGRPAGQRRQRLRIVGTTLLHSQLSNDLTMGAGALLALDGLRRLVPDAAPNLFLVEYAPGADPEAAFQSLRRDFGRIVLRPLDNEEVENLARVGGLPYVLAGLLALLGVGTIAHTLVSSIRPPATRPGRAQDPRVRPRPGPGHRGLAGDRLRGPGRGRRHPPRGRRRPLGLGPGQPGPPLPGRSGHANPGRAGRVPATVLVANLVAALPARAAAATRPAVVLRSE